MKSYICRICASDQTKSEYTVHEMMFGTREVFDYFECAECGCLQIADFPPDIGKYYDTKNYYSIKAPNPIRRRLRDAQIGYLITGHNLLGWALTRLKPPQVEPHLAPEGVAKTARILDIGCGNGVYLNKLAELGFRHLYGIDPFLTAGAIRKHPFPLESKTIFDLNPASHAFDAIVSNHTLEHIPEQHEFLARARDLLSPGGVIVIRIPYASSYAWEHYRTDWVQLDAPRHLFLHTQQSLQVLADRAGLKITLLKCDSTGGQFWGSEQYRRGIALYANNSLVVSPGKSIFTAEQLREFDQKAIQLNSAGRGDQVAVYFNV